MPAQKPLLLPHPMPFPHHQDTYPTPAPTPSPQPQLPTASSFSNTILDAISKFPHQLLWLLIAVIGLLVIHKAVAFWKSYATMDLARRELRDSLIERAEKCEFYDEDGGED